MRIFLRLLSSSAFSSLLLVMPCLGECSSEHTGTHTSPDHLTESTHHFHITVEPDHSQQPVSLYFSAPVNKVRTSDGLMLTGCHQNDGLYRVDVYFDPVTKPTTHSVLLSGSAELCSPLSDSKTRPATDRPIGLSTTGTRELLMSGLLKSAIEKKEKSKGLLGSGWSWFGSLSANKDLQWLPSSINQQDLMVYMVTDWMDESSENGSLNASEGNTGPCPHSGTSRVVRCCESQVVQRGAVILTTNGGRVRISQPQVGTVSSSYSATLRYSNGAQVDFRFDSPPDHLTFQQWLDQIKAQPCPGCKQEREEGSQSSSADKESSDASCSIL